ncbi:hypothetical protein, variant [Blastomyces dermatitidis ATCC 26199]|nr:hypothetical protein BDFG_03092 [Blastomyces dermatitidis ATCC 26199]EQL35105.1 hypothetical protein, variant [Blastomyces dermatitidis ATCC 26199]
MVDLTGDSDNSDKEDIADADTLLDMFRASGPEIAATSTQDNDPGNQTGDLTGVAPAPAPAPADADAGTPSPVAKRERSLTPEPSVARPTSSLRGRRLRPRRSQHAQHAQRAISTDSTGTERASPPPPDKILSERSGSGPVYLRQMCSAGGLRYWSITFLGDLKFSGSENEVVSSPRRKRRRT